MVDRKRRKIAKKPQTQTDPDSWVTEGGVDPEIESTITPVKEESKEINQKVVASSLNEVGASTSENEKTYPHRISFDMDNPQYKRLKWASFDSERPMNSILREAVEEWMKSRNY